MPDDAAAEMVARFLRMNNYHETLDAFLREANLPPDTGDTSLKNALTIEQVLQEKRLFDATVNFEKLGVEDGQKSWTTPAPSSATTVDTLSGAANILHVSIGHGRDYTGLGGAMDFMLATAADKTMNLLSTRAPYEPLDLRPAASESPILSCEVIRDRYIVSTSMAGHTLLFDIAAGKVLDVRKDHLKYAVKVRAKTVHEQTWIATAAWDAKVFLYRMDGMTRDSIKLGEPVGIVELPTNPEAVCFIDHPEISTPVLLLTRKDSTFLHYYTIPETVANDRNSTPKPLLLLGRQNLAPHSNAWIAFTPSALALSPTDPSVVAVATSAVPHMKLIIVRLLLPPPPGSAAASESASASSPLSTVNGMATLATPAERAPAAQARSALAVQGREAAAIQIQSTTMAPQTPYSTPDLAWRPDGSGVWVNGDDGVVRGVEASTGKVVATLKDGGHEQGTKIRCIWAGMVAVAGKTEEWVVSGGFDRRLIVWK